MKKSSRQSEEGVCQVFLSGDKAILLSLSCETDFVAKNKQFLNFFVKLGQFILNQDKSTIDEVLRLQLDNETIENQILQLSGLLGEKIVIKDFLALKKSSDQAFACYNHNNNRICSLLLLSSDVNFKEDLAMHAVAFEPQFISLKDVSQEFIKKERDIIVEQVNKEFGTSKSLEIRKRMINGRLEKFLKEICLLEQKFIRDAQQTVSNLLEKNQTVVQQMYIFKAGA